VPIKAISAQADDKTKISTIRLVLEVVSREQMDKVIKMLQKKSDIIDVYRTQG
jgi:(p)ppGpp synthase/HD superfamily hydrolase